MIVRSACCLHSGRGQLRCPKTSAWSLEQQLFYFMRSTRRASNGVEIGRMAMHPVSRAVRAGGMAIFSSDRTSQPEVGFGFAFISSSFHPEDESSESQSPQHHIKTVARPRRVQPPSVIHCGSRANGLERIPLALPTPSAALSLMGFEVSTATANVYAYPAALLGQTTNTDNVS